MFLLRGIKKYYDKQPILDLPHWHSERGEHHLILGPSGSGKTSLLHIMASLLTADEGTTIIAGQDISRLSLAQRDQFRGQNIGIVFQKLHLLHNLTVSENLLLAQHLANIPQDKQWVFEVLNQLNLGKYVHARLATLSQGQAQRVALARAVINQPQIILADEPTSNLDDRHCLQVLDLLEAQADKCHATLVIATHDSRVKQRFSKQLNLDVPA